MNASSRTASTRRTTQSGSSGRQLDVDRIRRLAADYENDATIPQMMTDQAMAVVHVLGTRRPRAVRTAS